MNQIFLIGTSRSGSNMLRVMLNQSTQIDAPHPPFFMERMSPFLSTFGDLGNDANFRRLVDTACRLVETNPVPWDLPLDRESVFRRCPARSLVAVYGTLMDLSAEYHGCGSWLCKASANVHYLPEISRHFGDSARYLHLVRDGRDVLLSYIKAVVGEKTAYHVAAQWRQEQELVLALQQRVRPGQVFTVRYEDILERPETSLRAICDWLGVAFTPDLLAFHASEEARKIADKGAMWANLDKPILGGNKEKWRRELSPEQILVFESVAHRALEHFGYRCEMVRAGRLEPLALSGEDIRYFDHLNTRMKQYVMTRIPPEDLAKRKPQDDVLREMARNLDDPAAVRLPLGSVVIPIVEEVAAERSRTPGAA